MVDSRALNAVTSTSAFNFKSGDISGTAAKLTDEKMGQGSEYFLMGEEGQQVVPQNAPYIDRSAQLRATLNSLAMMNVANLLANKKKQAILSGDTSPDTNEISDIEKNSEEPVINSENTDNVEKQMDDDAVIDAILEELDELELDLDSE